MDWRRVVEGLAVVALLVAALATFGDPRRTLSTLTAVDVVPYSMALATTLVGTVVWSGSLAALLRAQGVDVRPGWFQTVFVAGMGLRSVVPGGSASGPAVLGYVVSRTTDAPGETCVAMAYVLDVLLWVGSAGVGAAGVASLFAFHHPSAQVLNLVFGLAVLTVVAFGVVLYGVRHPETMETFADRFVAAVSRLAEHISNRLGDLVADNLDPDAVDDRLDRFFGAFARLAEDPTHLVPALAFAVAGWFVHATTLYFVFISLGVHPPYAVALFVVPVGGLTEGLSVLPGGIGAVEPAFATLIVLLTPVSVGTAATVVVLYRLSNYWFRIGLGFLALPVLGANDLAEGSFDAAGEA